jgi:glyoxalase family protein
VDFYEGVLGMRLVKRSVNQDSPGTYHLFYADGEGHPGSDLTFFPWPEMPPAKAGAGLAMEVSLAVPIGSADYWADRLRENHVSVGEVEIRRGTSAFAFSDPHGLQLAIHETADEREFTPWRESPVQADKQIRGLHTVRLWESDLAQTAAFLTGVLGFVDIGSEGDWTAFAIGGGGSGRYVELRQTPDAPWGRWGVGGVHHVAWRVPDDATELSVRETIARAHRRPTEVIDRFWFKSVYFLEPGGVLFEIATDGPGFAIDEDPATLGEHLVLPPWLEPHREEIEAALPPLKLPVVPATRP